ncbi:MAG: response regulator [Opitutaceae bacterium]
MSPVANKCIVIVDDEKSYGELLSQLVRDNLNRPVVAFAHPVAALEAMPGLNIGVVVTDYFMPELDGAQFIRRAAPRLPGVPFLIITGHPVRLSDNFLDDLPALKAVLPKPFRWQKLAELIVRHWPDDASRPKLSA